MKDHLVTQPYSHFLLYLTLMFLYNLTQSKSILSRVSACLLYTLEPCIFPSACLKSAIVIGRNGSDSILHACELSELLKHIIYGQFIIRQSAINSQEHVLFITFFHCLLI